MARVTVTTDEGEVVETFTDTNGDLPLTDSHLPLALLSSTVYEAIARAREIGHEDGWRPTTTRQGAEQ